MDKKIVVSTFQSSKAIYSGPEVKDFEWTFEIPSGIDFNKEKTIQSRNLTGNKLNNLQNTTGFLDDIEKRWGLLLNSNQLSTFMLLPKDNHRQMYRILEAKLQLISSNKIVSEDSITTFCEGKAPDVTNVMWTGSWQKPVEIGNNAINVFCIIFKIERHTMRHIDSLYSPQQEKAIREILKSFHRINSDGFLFSEHLSDIVLECAGKEYPAHRFMLSCRSVVFNKMFRAGLKEVAEGRVVVKEIESEIFEELLRFIYTSRVNCIEEICMDLFIAADLYDVAALRLLCEKEMIRQLDVDNALDIFMVAEDHHSKVLKETAFAFLQRNKETLFNDREAFNMFSARYPDRALQLFKSRRNK